MTTDTAPTTRTGAVDLDEIVAATPDDRDRTVDAVRALCIAVVVLWHWVFSITHVTKAGALSMPNPVDEIPGAWLLTWVLQVMPAFFVVGGFSNRASWERLERLGTARWGTYAAARMKRLWTPLLPMLGFWLAADFLARSVLGVPSVLSWGLVVFVPLWFIAAYSAVSLLAPLMLRAHRARPLLTMAGLATGIATADALRFNTGEDRWGYLTTALVWIAAHQLGFAWRDGAVVGWARRHQLMLLGGAVTALGALTSFGPYPASMVATRGGEISNMFPTTAPVAVLAVVQLAVIALVRPTLEPRLRQARTWRKVVVANAVAMPVFAWHMTALVAVIGVVTGLGFTLPSETSTSWWLLRPFWLIAPGLALTTILPLARRLDR